MKPAFLFFILLQFSICSLTVSVTWTSSPSSPTGIQGQSVTITWTAELPSGAEFQNVKVIQFISSSSENQVIMVDRAGGRTVYALYSSRDADVNLTASENGALVTSVFTLKNLNQSADQHQYHLRVLYKTGPFAFDSKDSPNLQLTVLVSPTITSPDPCPGSVTVNETQTAQLVCTATGNPAPSYNWTRDGVIVGTGSPFTTPAVTFNDDNACYTCIAYNGVLDAKTANVCLNVQYKPTSTSLTSTLSNARLTDSVTLQCTTDANPPVYEYRFYLNDVLVHTSMSGVYQVKVPQEGNNEYKCEPVNTVGAGQNGTVIITKDSYVAPNFSNITITGASVTVMWSNLHFPQKTMVTCWLNVKESSHGLKWMTSSNTSYGSSISCSFSGLQPSTLYRIHYALRIHKNYVNGTIYVATPYEGSSHPTSNTGRSSTAFIAVIVVAVVIILLLILVVLWMRFKDCQKNRRTKSKDQNKTEVQLQTFETDNENEGFVFRDSQTDGDIVLHEQVQNRDLARNQGVDSAPSIPMENLPEISEKFAREARATATDNQTQSKYQEPSYQSLDQKEVGAGKRFHDTQDSYGHLVGFTRRPAHNATISTEDQNPYQELQLENRSKGIISHFKKSKTAFNV